MNKIMKLIYRRQSVLNMTKRNSNDEMRNNSMIYEVIKNQIAEKVDNKM